MPVWVTACSPVCPTVRLPSCLSACLSAGLLICLVLICLPVYLLSAACRCLLVCLPTCWLITVQLQWIVGPLYFKFSPLEPSIWFILFFFLFFCIHNLSLLTSVSFKVYDFSPWPGVNLWQLRDVYSLRPLNLLWSSGTLGSELSNSRSFLLSSKNSLSLRWHRRPSHVVRVAEPELQLWSASFMMDPRGKPSRSQECQLR